MSRARAGAGVAERLAVASRYAGEGRIDDVLAAVGEARVAASGSLGREDAVLAGVVVATTYVNNGRHAEARAELEAVRPLVPDVSPVRQARFGVLSSALTHYAGDDDRAIDEIVAVLSVLAESRPDPSEDLGLVLGNCSAMLAALQLFALAIEVGHAAADNARALGRSAARFRFQTGYAQAQWAIRALHVGADAEAREHFLGAAALLEEAVQEPDEVGALFVARAYALLAICWSRLGHAERACELVATARSIRSTWSEPQRRLLAHAEGAALIAAGWYGQATQLLVKTWADAEQHPTVPVFVDIPYLLGVAAEAAGEPRAALRWYTEVHNRYAQSDYAVANARAEAAYLKIAQDKLLQHSRQLEWDARADPLTGVANRRALDETLAGRFAAPWPGDGPLSLVVVDVDHFKRINDDLGHPVGDEVLRQVALLLRQHIRGADVCSRYGGDEFVLVLTAEQSVARSIARRAAADVAAHPWAGDLAVTVTCGVAQRAADHTPATLFATADADLLRAKRARRRTPTTA